MRVATSCRAESTSTRGGRCALGQRGEHVEAVETGQEEVEHDEVPLVCGDLRQRLGAVAGDRRVVPRGLQSVGQEAREQRLVFGDQNVHGERTPARRPYHLRARANMTGR